jgi:hypothetical protein
MSDKFSDDEERKLAREAILKLARALARQAAREDHKKSKQDWRKKPRKRVLKPTR